MGYPIMMEVKKDAGKGILYGGLQTESKMSEHTVSEVGVDGDKILIDLKANTEIFGICRLPDNRHNGFMTQYLYDFLYGRRHGGENEVT